MHFAHLKLRSSQLMSFPVNREKITATVAGPMSAFYEHRAWPIGKHHRLLEIGSGERRSGQESRITGDQVRICELRTRRGAKDGIYHQGDILRKNVENKVDDSGLSKHAGFDGRDWKVVEDCPELAGDFREGQWVNAKDSARGLRSYGGDHASTKHTTALEASQVGLNSGAATAITSGDA
ncbi:MAG: hypothetical protein ACI8W8_002154 [Rhodothermales bacterium]|jgi:hypothetical protein